MKTLSSVLLGAAAGVAAFGAVAVASGAPAAPKDQSSVQMKVAQLDVGEPGRPQRARSDADRPQPPRGPEGPPPPFGPPQGRFGGPTAPFGPGGPMGLSARLSAEETAIGVRGAQLDAWRDYADALQEVLAPPPPPPAAGGGTADPFVMSEALAAEAEKRGKAGAALKTAVAALRSQLTPEQLVRAARTMVPPPPGMPPHPFPAGPADGGERTEPGPSSPR